MAEELKLSKALIENVTDVLIEIDNRAKDPFIASQYLSAVVGYMVGTSAIPEQDKKEIVDELCSFMQHVFQDVSKPQQSVPVAPPGQAFGIWKPGDS